MRLASKDSLSVWAVMIVALSVYVNSLGNGFVWDDHYFIENRDNQTALSLTNLINSSFPVAGTGSYRPVRNLFYPLLYGVCNQTPGCYRLWTIGLHALVSALVYLLAKKLTQNESASLAAGLLFAAHPIHSEAVMWLTAGFDLVFAVFYLSSFYLFLEARGGKKTLFKWSYLLAFLAYLSNELALTLPLLMAAFTWLVAKKKFKEVIKITGVYWVLWLSYWFIRFNWLAEAGHYQRVYGSIGMNLLLMVVMLGQYIKLLFLPLALSVDRLFTTGLSGLFGVDNDRLTAAPALALSDPWVLVSVALVAGGVILLITTYKKMPLIAFFLFWIVVTLLPVLGVVPLPIIFAERYAYLASVGWCLLVAYGVSSIKLPPKLMGIDKKKWGVGAITIIVLLYGYLISVRSRDWKNDQTLWSKTLGENPGSAAAANSLAGYYISQNDYQGALTYSQLAVSINPDVTRHQKTLIALYQKLDMDEQLIALMTQLIEREPQNADLIFSLGKVYEEDLTDLDKARQYYLQADKLVPNHPQIKAALERVGTTK